MTPTPSMSAKVRIALDAMWPGVYQASRAHLAVIEDFMLAADTATTAQRTAACSAAHKLSGSLGMFGRHAASGVAATIEQQLATDTTATRLELRTLIDRLDHLLGTTA